MDGKGAALLALAIALAGCLSGDEPVDAATTQSDPVVAPDVTRAEDGVKLYAARFGEGAPVDVTEWHNGTFKIEQHRRVGPLPGAAPAQQAGSVLEFDITKLVPQGIPTLVIAEVDAELAQGDLDLGMNVPDGEWRTGNWNTPSGGFSRFETGIVHTSADPISVVLAYDEVEPQPEFAYTLSIRVVSDPALLLNGIVSAATLPADAKLEVEAIGEARDAGPEVEAFALHVFGPDDALVGSFPLASGATPIALPAGSPAGEYVLLLSQGGRNARVLVEGAPAPMRALGIEWLSGEMAELDATGHGTVSATFDKAPLLVGVFFTAPNVARSMQFAMTGPKGPLFSGSDGSSDLPWLSFGVPGGPMFMNAWGWDSLWGAPELVPGAYQADIAFESGAGAQPAVAQVYAAFFQR